MKDFAIPMFLLYGNILFFLLQRVEPKLSREWTSLYLYGYVFKTIHELFIVFF